MVAIIQVKGSHASLEVFGEDRLGLTRELLDLLVLRSVIYAGRDCYWANLS